MSLEKHNNLTLPKVMLSLLVMISKIWLDDSQVDVVFPSEGMNYFMVVQRDLINEAQDELVVAGCMEEDLPC